MMILSWISASAEDKSVTKSKVDELIRDLDAKTLIDRSQAERQLMELGPQVLILLPTPEQIDSNSVREAIRRIRPQLERRAARESSAPFPITFKGELTLSEILKELQSQSRNEITLADDTADLASRRVNVDWTKTHFWDGVDDICQRASLRWQFAKEAAAIRIFPATEPAKTALAVQRNGPFRMELQEIEIQPIVGDERHKLIRVEGQLALEPRLRPLFLTMAVENLHAVANENIHIPVWNPGAKYEFAVGDGGHQASIRWDFLHPLNAKLKTLSIGAHLQCQIAAARERVEFDQKSQARGTVRRRGGVSVRLRQVAFEPLPNDRTNAEIGITVSYDNGGPAFESHRSWIFHNAVYLETKAGVKTNYTDFEIAQQADGAVAVDYRWKNIAGPGNQYLFVYEAPTLIIDVPIDVQFIKVPVNPPEADSQKGEGRK